MSTLEAEMKTHALEAQIFSRKHLVLELDFSETSVQEIENQCGSVDYALRGGKSPENLDMLTRTWGAYLGESLRRATGAEWISEDSAGGRRIGLRGSSGHVVYPHEHVRKRLTGTGADSLSTYFRTARDSLQGQD